MSQRCLSRPEGEDPAEALVASGLAVIGTPDDAIAQIKRLEAESGGFGTFLHMAHNWADWAETKRSYALFSRYVAPEFQHRNDNRRASYEWAAREPHAHISAKMEQAIGIKNTKVVKTPKVIQKHAKGKAERQRNSNVITCTDLYSVFIKS